MAEVETFRFDLSGRLRFQSVDSETVVPVFMEGDAAAPDRASGAMTIGVLMFALRMDVIIIGESAWTTNPQTDTWQAVDARSLGIPNPAMLVSDGSLALDEPAIAGEEQIEGVRTTLVEGGLQLDEVTNVARSEATATLWIGADDYRIYKIGYEGIIDADALGLSLDSMGLTGDAAIIFDLRLSEFDAPISIEPPIIVE